MLIALASSGESVIVCKIEQGYALHSYSFLRQPKWLDAEEVLSMEKPPIKEVLRPESSVLVSNFTYRVVS
jgi:hypothetical protein